MLLWALCLGGLRAEAIPEMETALRDQEPLHKYNGVELFGYVGAGLGFDNNVFLTHSNRKAALFAFLIPGVRAKRNEDNNHIFIQFDYQARGRRYVGESNVDKASHIEHQFLLYSTWKPRSTIEWQFMENAAYLVDPVAADIPRQERFENELSAKLLYKARTTDFAGRAGLNILRFSRSAFRVLDRDNWFFELSANYHNLGPRAQVVGLYRLDYFNNRDSSRSDLTVHYLMAGLATPLGENKGWVYEAQLGLGYMEVISNRAATPGAKQLTSFAFSLSAKWTQTDPRTFLNFILRNEFQPSTIAGATFSNAVTFVASGQYAVNKALTGGLTVQQQWVEQYSSNADVARLKIMGVITYHRLEKLSFFGRIEFINRFGHLRTDRYDDLRLLGGATYVF